MVKTTATRRSARSADVLNGAEGGAPPPPPAERTQAELAYKELSHRIVVSEILPNERIIEQFWAQKLGVNRAAIRESLTRLLGEGLVRQGERRGFFVSELSREDILQLREVREILEIGAFLLACDRATTKQIQQIEDTVDDLASFVKKGYFTGAHEADLRFHQLLMNASGNPRLGLLYERSHIPLFQRKNPQSRTPLEEFTKTESEHRSIVEALRRRDKEGGTEALRRHFKRGATEALK
ncbi:MAG TPA: GntR family transcriptional regulator [Clostridia bacterium]|nr:GntR family transcriptional regulator [Clostridia bacterium]